MASGRSHPIIDRFNRHLRKESKKEAVVPNAERGIETSERRDSPPEESALQNSERVSGKAQQTGTFGLAHAPDAGYGPPDTSDEIHRISKRRPDEDGKSVSSNMKDLSIQTGKNTTVNNKRAAAEPPLGQSPEGHPNKLRSASTDDSFGRSTSQHPPRAALYYDPTRDQRPQPPVHVLPANNESVSPVYASTTAAQTGGGIIPRDRLPPTFQSSLGKINTPFVNPEMERVASHSPPSSPAFNTTSDRDSGMLLQPETRPITQEQLVNEVKGIYAGLVMVEKKCVEIDQQQASTTNKLSNEQWQALIALHRTLLHEHHDFFLASQHPSSSPALRRLATKYAMPARMWRHGIHSFLELLRHRLPESLDHMLAFVYLAYSMMALLMESVPSFEETWIECLGDLARYRMAIEEADLRDREVWSGVARMWYNMAADKSPNVGRIQHHLAVLARPNIVQQLFYYSKALVSAIPFQNARESIMLLFNPFLEGSEIASQRYALIESALVKASGILFTHGSLIDYSSLMDQFFSTLDNHIGRVTAKFRVQGPEIASSLCAATFDFGNANTFLSQCFREQEDLKKAQFLASQTPSTQEEPRPEDPKAKYATMQAYWASIDDTAEPLRADPRPATDSTTRDALFRDSDDAAAYACRYLGKTTTVVAQRIGDKNILPYMHVVLAYLFGLAFVPNALIYVEGCIPWENITIFLNTLGRSSVVKARFEGDDFPQQLSGTGRQLPEDFVMRGLIWAQHYFPAEFFSGQIVDEDERNLELPSHAAPRAERCLWLGVRLASLNRWIRYDSHVQQFSITHFARSLESMQTHTLDSRSQTMSAERDLDTDMIDVEHER